MAAAAVNVAEMMSGSSNSVYKRCMCSVIFSGHDVYVLILNFGVDRQENQGHERQELVLLCCCCCLLMHWNLL